MHYMPCTVVPAEVVLECCIRMRYGNGRERGVSGEVGRGEEEVDVYHVVNNATYEEGL